MEAKHLIQSPIGWIKIIYTDKGIKSVKFTDEENETLEHRASTENIHLQLAIKWFETYLKDPAKTKSLKYPNLDMETYGSKVFMCKVWNVLMEKVGPGQTISYGELAKLCHNPGSARAVGQAMRRNPYTILVPCHRVINSGGSMGNYSGGIHKKQWLLKHEGKEF